MGPPSGELCPEGWDLSALYRRLAQPGGQTINPGIFHEYVVRAGLHSYDQSYLLRGICIHSKSHNLPLFLGLNYAYLFPGVGTSRLRLLGGATLPPAVTSDFLLENDDFLLNK